MIQAKIYLETFQLKIKGKSLGASRPMFIILHTSLFSHMCMMLTIVAIASCQLTSQALLAD